MSDNRESSCRVRKMTIQEMEKIYQQQLVNDFPPNETKPFSSIKEMWEKGIYRGYVLEENNRLCAYWYTLYIEKENIKLLDYFAVVQAYRGKGYGSLVMRYLKKQVAVSDSIIFIESENPQKSRTQEEQVVREKRLQFYQNNGAKDTEFRTGVYQADYILLALGEIVDKRDTEDWIRRVYQEFYTRAILPQNGDDMETAGFYMERQEGKMTKKANVLHDYD